MHNAPRSALKTGFGRIAKRSGRIVKPTAARPLWRKTVRQFQTLQWQYRQPGRVENPVRPQVAHQHPRSVMPMSVEPELQEPELQRASSPVSPQLSRCSSSSSSSGCELESDMESEACTPSFQGQIVPESDDDLCFLSGEDWFDTESLYWNQSESSPFGPDLTEEPVKNLPVSIPLNKLPQSIVGQGMDDQSPDDQGSIACSMSVDEGYGSSAGSCWYSDVPEWIGTPVEYRPAVEALLRLPAHEREGRVSDWLSRMPEPVSLTELRQVMELSQQYALVDVGATTKRFKERMVETRNADIQDQLKALTEEVLPQDSRDERQHRVLVKAEAARQLKFVRCDDRCYFWLALWLSSQTETRKSYLVEVNYCQPAGYTGKTPNHYLLLIPPADFRQRLNLDQTHALMQQGQLNTDLAETLAEAGFVMVDPTTLTVLPVTSDNLSRHLEMVAHIYGFRHQGELSLSVVERCTKASVVTGEQRRQAKQQARQLIPLAALLAARDNTGYVDHLQRRMNVLGLTPADIWPDKISPQAPWNHSVVYCLRDLYPESDRIRNLIVDDQRPNDFDVMACYRSDRSEYCEALARQTIRYLKLGKSTKECLKRMSEHGFHGDHKDGIWDGRGNPYRIPALPEIPKAFHNQTDWLALGEQGLRAIGVEPERYAMSLKSLLERRMQGVNTGSGGVHSSLTYAYRDIWLDRPEIKTAIKAVETNRPALTRHLIHESGACVPEHLQDLEAYQWTPIDTLQVCDPESMAYRRAMALFLCSGGDAEELAGRLQVAALSRNPDAHDRTLAQVELPAFLRTQFRQWCPEAVRVLMKAWGVQEADPLVLLAEHARSLFDTDYDGDTDVLMKRLETRLRRNPQIFRYTRLVLEDAGEQEMAHHHSAHLRVVWRLVQTTLPQRLRRSMPAGVLEALRPRDDDGLLMMKPGTASWKRGVVRSVRRGLKQGHSLTALAIRLNHSKCYQVDHEGDLDQGSAESEWTFASLHAFLLAQGFPLEKTFRKFGDRALAAKIECGVYRHQRKVKRFDGLLLDGLLSRGFKSADFSSARLSCLRRVLTRPENNPRYKSVAKRDLQARFEQLKRQAKGR
ncbi:hypothetical protein PAHA111176_04650 [Parendozoicomonas haliclonae]|uniref:Uncharacterized protein n=2 Tax=Parendozoicomonas haliclonae TaxID=1960125 RepID=A0A1X7AK69_9GAMM|nr:hypothetical protein EHSB41UT_02293 [Parendozoicomonas haliclonae]